MKMNLTNKPTTFMWLLHLSKWQIHTFCCLRLKSGVILTPVLNLASKHIFSTYSIVLHIFSTYSIDPQNVIKTQVQYKPFPPRPLPPGPKASPGVLQASPSGQTRSHFRGPGSLFLFPLCRMLFFLHALSVHFLVLGLNVTLSERSFTSTLYSYPLIPQKPLSLLYLLYDTHHHDSFIHYFHHSTIECFIHYCVSGT